MTKRGKESLPIKDLMHSFINENNLSKGMQKLRVEETWSKLMGKGVLSYTDSVQLQHKTLIVRLSSSALREELSYGKDKIIKMINEEMGAKVISKLMLI